VGLARRDASFAATLALPVVSHLSCDARRTLAGVWEFRANAEREAELRFARLEQQLRSHDALPEAIALAERAVSDERRHVTICSELARAYGGGEPRLVPVSARPLGPAALAPCDRLLYEIVAFCCISESFNASLMKVASDRASVPETRAALRAILRDEVGHARLGWAHLAAERMRGRGAFLSELSPRMLAGAIRSELFAPGPPHPDADELETHGELSERERLAIFEMAADTVILPGFEAQGIDTRPMRDWIQRMRRKGSDVLG
jgi:hypothetical protein